MTTPITTWRPKPDSRAALAAKLIEQADLLERTRTSLDALWWDCADGYERSFVRAVIHSFGLYAEDLCLEAGRLLGQQLQRMPRHVDRSGLVVRVNNLELLFTLLEDGYSDLGQGPGYVNVLTEQRAEFGHLKAAFEMLFGEPAEADHNAWQHAAQPALQA